ncbi:hypothetical protein XENOCAPTIV_028797 [Xenoophorus captivus]|uniref:ATP-dependent RNA helicase PRP5/DDX46/KHDC4 KH domain-containing protein n=1 Tax=Xenoophorus captivus TaxID=1517983 RepID=A0ABV0RFK9_9TELE
MFSATFPRAMEALARRILGKPIEVQVGGRSVVCSDVEQHVEGKVIKSSSGFSGKGFKFDETEHALANERKKLQKAALGLQDSDDEEGALDQATNAILRGDPIMTPSVSAKTIAEQLAEKINAKLNYTPVEKLEEERQAAEQAESVKRYEEELEINDFPQTARWKVTSKEALQRIGEYSEAAITIRGTYFPPGKEPKEGERKIYLAIESMY